MTAVRICRCVGKRGNAMLQREGCRIDAVVSLFRLKFLSEQRDTGTMKGFHFSFFAARPVGVNIAK